MAERASGESERRKGKDDEESPKPKAEVKDKDRDKNGNGRSSGSLPPPEPSSGSVGRASGESETPARKTKGGSIPPPRPSRPASEDEIPDEPRHPSIPPLPAAGPWRSYKEIVAGLAQRIVDAQREIRVLQAIRWDNDVEEQFKKSRYRELPKVDGEYYDRNPLGFEPSAKVAVFEEIARDVDRELGEADAIGAILGRTALEYRDVVRMLAARSTPVFYAYSRKLYGSPKDKFPDGIATLRDLGHLLYEILTNIDESLLGMQYER